MLIHKITENDVDKIKLWIKKEFSTDTFENTFSTTIGCYEDDIIAFLTYSFMYDRAEIDYIYVDLKYRKNGIAQALFNEMINNIGNVSISLEVNVNNEAAIEFYKKNGFKIISKREKYYQGVDGYLMVRGEV